MWPSTGRAPDTVGGVRLFMIMITSFGARSGGDGHEVTAVAGTDDETVDVGAGHVGPAFEDEGCRVGGDAVPGRGYPPAAHDRGLAGAGNREELACARAGDAGQF